MFQERKWTLSDKVPALEICKHWSVTRWRGERGRNSAAEFTFTQCPGYYRHTLVT